MNTPRLIASPIARPIARLVLGCVVAIASLTTWFVLHPAGGPMYREESIGHYFPRWERQTGTGERPQPWPGDAGVDAIPFLVEVMRREDGRITSRLIDWWNKLPQPLLDRLPTPRPAGWIRDEAFGHLLEIVRSREGMAELAPRFDSLPVESQETFLVYFANMPEVMDYTKPLLKHALRYSADRRQAAAVASLLAIESPGSELMRELVDVLERRYRRSGLTGWDWGRYSVLLGRLGPEGRIAIPLLERLKKSPDRRTRLTAGLGLIHIDPQRQTYRDFFEQEVVPGGWQEVSGFVDALGLVRLQSRSDLKRPPLNEVLPLLVMLLSGDYLAESLHLDPERNDSGTLALLQKTAASIGRIRSAAAPAVPALVLLLSHHHPDVRLAAAQALQNIGPVRPDSVPQLLAAMSDGALHEQLVPLLGRYGGAASNALPDLQILAAGEWRDHWSNSPAESYSMNEVLFRRYGLLPSSDTNPSAPPYVMNEVLRKRYGLLPSSDPKDQASPGSKKVTSELQKAAAKAAEQIKGDTVPSKN